MYSVFLTIISFVLLWINISYCYVNFKQVLKNVNLKIVKVKYFEETITNGKYSLRFPRFIEIRKDKTEPSYE